MKIAVIGATIVDIVSYVENAPTYGEAVTATDFHVACGGKGANQAVAAKKLGAEILMVSTVGDDVFGEMALKNFQKIGIETKNITKIKNLSNGIVNIIVESSAQYRSMFYHGACDFLTPEHILQAAEDLKSCGIFLIQLEIPIDTVYFAIDFAKKNKIPVLLNPSPLNKKIDIEKVSSCEFFVVNEDELRLLTDFPVETQENIRAAAKKLLNFGVKNIIVTLGHRGSVLFSKNVEEFVPAFEVESIDSTGAGDAFVGCFVKNYAQGKKISDAMQIASKYAAISVTRKGTQDSYLTAEEFEKIF